MRWSTNLDCETDIMQKTIQLIEASDTSASATDPSTLALANDIDPRTVSLNGITRIDLRFPKFTDGRAYSQAYLLRRRMGFTGELRATGDVLPDQLQLMQRSGFDTAVLCAGQDCAIAERQLTHFERFYQGDAVHTTPLFKATTGASA